MVKLYCVMKGGFYLAKKSLRFGAIMLIFLILMTNLSMGVLAQNPLNIKEINLKSDTFDRVVEKIKEKFSNPFKTFVMMNDNYLFFLYEYNDKITEIVMEEVKDENLEKNIKEENNVKVENNDQKKSTKDVFAVITREKSVIDKKEENKVNSSNQTENKFAINGFDKKVSSSNDKNLNNKNKFELEKNVDVKNSVKYKTGLVNEEREVDLESLKKDKKTYNNNEKSNQKQITYEDYEKYLNYLEENYDFK